MSASIGGARINDPYDLQRVMQTDFVVSDQQWVAISAPLEPAVVIAGAGSGKTALMAARVVYLVGNGLVDPGEVLGLTFTRKAAAELRTRVRDSLITAGVLGEPGRPGSAETPGEAEVMEPTVSTYHSYAADLLREHGLRLGHEPDTRVIADATRFQLAARVVARHTGTVEALSDHPDTVINAILALDGELAEHLVDADRLRGFDADARARFAVAYDAEAAGKARKTYLAPIEKAMAVIDQRRELLSLVAEYRAAKRDLGLMDYSDQIALGAQLAAEQPEVSQSERDRFAVVLLDEYQDTSVAQAQMLSRLFSGDDEADGRGHPVTAVGDPNQAIYGWRGASVSNILRFGEDFPRADGSRDVPVLPLSINRRSDRRILEVANTLAEPLLSDDVLALEAKPEAAEGRVAAIVHDHVGEELTWLAEEVRRTHDDGVPWSEIGVLVRDNAHAADAYDALTAVEVPVEIVGLGGLLRLPEVAEVVATLRLLHDVSANDALLTLLTGPRWAIGPRDLALLGARSRELGGSGRPETPEAVRDELAQAVAGSDPVDLSALCDALDDPGPGPYSQQARDRFALLAGELRMLRGHVGEPLVDLVRRVVDTCGVDIELAAAVSDAATSRRDNLDAFLAAVADFRGLDHGASLPALVAFLAAEEAQGTGLDAAPLSKADSVKLLTVHRAKGLEWDVVFVIGVGVDRFPSTQGRSLWTSSAAVLPNPLRGDYRDLAELEGHDKAALDDFREASKVREADEELRLGYVAFTRARHTLYVSSYVWGSRQRPHGPSAYQLTVRECIERWGEEPLRWVDAPEKGADNPYAGLGQSAPWPTEGSTREVEHRIAAAAVVTAAMDALDTGTPVAVDLAGEEAALAASWDRDLDRLLAEARAETGDVVDVQLPATLSATSLVRLAGDEQGFLADLVRPMPRPPAPAAAFGTRFHAWVEARSGQQQMLDPDDLPGRADAEIDDDADLAELIEKFEAGPFADRVPYAVEAPFALVAGGPVDGGLVVRGRIDAVYREPDGSWLVVDWKTNRAPTADAGQLAIYRRAWAELQGVPREQVRAAFYYVRTGRLDEPDLDEAERHLGW